MFKKAFLMIGIILSCAFVINAQVPKYVNYQGLLSDANGNPLTGNYTINFRIYSAATGGTLLWGPQSYNVNADAGVFSVELGSIDYSVFDGNDRWLSIEVGNDGPMSPRKRLVSVGYSFRAYDADKVDGKDASSFADASHNHSGGGDNLGNHTATQNLRLNGWWLSNDGGNEGIRVTNSGFVSVSNDISAGDDVIAADDVIGNGGVLGYNSTDRNRYGLLGVGSNGAVYGQYKDLSLTGATYGYLGSANYGASGTYNDDLVSTFGDLAGKNGGAYGQSSSTVYGRLGAVTGPRGVYGQNGANWGYIGGPSYAGYFNGTGRFTGTLTKPAGSFEIDHPLDPANKYLYHSFVESPDMMNIYNGNTVLDAKGEAWVELPDWFKALNKDHRYQLTPIGAPGPNLYIAEKISNNRFKIAGGTPGLEVSWQVTGVRQDAYANAHRIQVEVEKSGKERGKYLQPEVHGMPITMGIGYDVWLAQQQEVERMNESIKARAEEQKRAQEEIRRDRDNDLE